MNRVKMMNTRKLPPIKKIDDLIKVAQKLPAKKVVIAGANYPTELQSAALAVKKKIIKTAILVGNPKKILHFSKQLNIEISSREYEIIAIHGEEETAKQSVIAIKEGRGEILLKGHISSPVLTKRVLDKNLGLRMERIISQVTLAEIPEQGINRIILLTDPGVNNVYNYEKMVQMIENAAEVTHLVLSVKEPRVAALSANEKIMESLNSTLIADALTKKRWKDIILYGPLSYDLAIDPDSVKTKKVEKNTLARKVAGKADILLAPNMDAANIIYKNWMELAKKGRTKMANIVIGATVPYIIPSRADPPETKLYSLALCSIFIEVKNTFKDVKF